MKYQELVDLHGKIRQSWRDRDKDVKTDFEDLVTEWEYIKAEDLLIMLGEMLASFKVDEVMFNNALSLMEKKNHDYAIDEDRLSNLRYCQQIGLCPMGLGILIRMADKQSRLNNLKTKEAKVKDESTTDTLLDIINYSVLLYASVVEEY